MPTSQPTSVLTSGEEMTSPSSTIAMRRLGSPDGLQAALPVMLGPGVCQPLPLKSIADDPLDALFAAVTALAPVISSPWMTRSGRPRCVSPWSEDRTWLPFLLGFASGCAVADDLVDGQLGGLADPLLGLLRLLVAGDAGQLDEDPVLALADQRGLGDTEGVDAAAEHLERLVDVLRAGRRLLGALGLEDELRAAAEVEAEVGLDVDRERHAPGQEAEDEEEADPDTT